MQKVDQLKAAGLLLEGETLAAYCLRISAGTAGPAMPAATAPAPVPSLKEQLGEYDYRRLMVVRKRELSLNTLKHCTKKLETKRLPTIKWRKTLLPRGGPAEYRVEYVLSMRRFRRLTHLPWARTPVVIEAAKQLLIEKGAEKAPPSPQASSVRIHDFIMDLAQRDLYTEIIRKGYSCVMTDCGTYTCRQALRTGKGFMVIVIKFVSGKLTTEASRRLATLSRGHAPARWNMPTSPKEEEKHEVTEEEARNINQAQEYEALGNPRTWAADMVFITREDASTLAGHVRKVLQQVGTENVIWGMGDGASTNVGGTNGLWALLRDDGHLIYPVVCLSHTIDNCVKDVLNNEEDRAMAEKLFPGCKKGIVPIILETLSNLIRRDPDLAQKLPFRDAQWSRFEGCRFNLYVDLIIFLLSNGSPAHPNFDPANNRLHDILPVLSSHVIECARGEKKRLKAQKERKRKATSKPAAAVKPTSRYHLREQPAVLKKQEEDEDDETEEEEATVRTPKSKQDVGAKDLKTVVEVLKDVRFEIRLWAYLEATMRLKEDLVWSMSNHNRSMLLFHRLTETQRILKDACDHPENHFRQTFGLHEDSAKICSGAAQILYASHVRRFERYLHVPFLPAALGDMRVTREVAKLLQTETDNVWYSHAARVLGDERLAPALLKMEHPVHTLLRSAWWPGVLQKLREGQPLSAFPALEVILHAIYDPLPVSNVLSEKAVQTVKGLDQRQLRSETPHVLFRFRMNEDLPLKEWQWRVARGKYEAKARRAAEERALAKKRRAEASKSSAVGKKKQRMSPEKDEMDAPTPTPPGTPVRGEKKEERTNRRSHDLMLEWRDWEQMAHQESQFLWRIYHQVIRVIYSFSHPGDFQASTHSVHFRHSSILISPPPLGTGSTKHLDRSKFFRMHILDQPTHPGPGPSDLSGPPSRTHRARNQSHMSRRCLSRRVTGTWRRLSRQLVESIWVRPRESGTMIGFRKSHPKNAAISQLSQMDGH
ncbi:hypothetical protein PAPYR_7391 [Paratrimastix pyriformis]|uniref:DUF659 domain-containing protein n=1 Tax=Paratrimastix pyriformis TaxID=342808 RepID=A0ABQ8UIH5_9EUKA|nr:hypothetical protein PAPYR_7391 [Paratrimastix pyriformis]